MEPERVWPAMTSRYRLPGLRVLLLVLACLAVIAGAAVLLTASRHDSDLDPAEQTFRAAMQAQMAWTIPPTETQPMVAGQQPSPVPAAALAEQKATGQASLARYFSGAAARQVAQGLTSAIESEADGVGHVTGAGVSKVVFDSVSVSGSQATAKAAVTTWSSAQQQNPDGTWVGAHPSNVMDYTARMATDGAGNWRITSRVGEFAPGSEP